MTELSPPERSGGRPGLPTTRTWEVTAEKDKM